MKPQIKKKSRGKKFLAFLSVSVVATITIAILVNLSNTSSTNAYTITWENYDGVVLETDENVKYGSMPSYDGATPTRSGTSQYSYTFSGWSPTITLVTGDQTYTAVFGNSLNSYTITWENYDGATLEVDNAVAYGTMPSYDGAIPTKNGDAQYSYTFNGWSPEVTSVTSNATYTAQFTSSTNAYTITWKNYDDTVLEVDEEVPHGTFPTYDGETPTKSGDAQYSYAFSGWSPEVTSVTSNATYTAQFTSSTNAYTITWKNYDDTVLEVDEEVLHGTLPTYDGETPTKSGDAQYEYTFKEWTPEVSMATSDQTYIATYLENVKTYTITWNNYDGTTLEVDSGVAYGATPTYDGETPTKSGDTQYSYTFSGWSPEVTSVTSSATYTAQFTSSTNAYTITWNNHDGTILETDTNVPYGTMPSYEGLLPTKEGDAQYTYNFIGWSPEVTSVTGDATYTAQFSDAINYYTITWENSDGTVLETDSVAYGSTPTYDGATPSKDGSAQYTYTFSGWSPSVVAVTSDATYIAQFSSAINSYTITWKNYDGTVLETDSVAYGAMPSYDGATPVRDSDAQYTYNFIGWSPEVTSVTGDATYTAQFSDAINYYTITWENSDGTVLETDSVAYGSTPTYDGATPSKDGSAQYTYTFSGWSPSVVAVTSDATYIAQFSSAINSYTITWENYDGTVLETDSVAYGSTPTYDGATPTREEDEEGTYLFSSWSPSVTIVNGDQTYTAQYIVTNYNDFLVYTLNSDEISYSVKLQSGTTPISIIIPSTYLGKPVTSIGTWAFSSCTSLTSIVIPDSVTSIDDRAFSSCTSLTSIVIPNSVTTIGDYAFYRCTSLTSIVIPDSVTSIGDGAFSSCTSLTSIVIPDSVTSIGNYAFSGCSSLISIEIPDSVTSIGDGAFYNCTSLTSIVIPNSVTTIGNNAFSYCTSLTSINVNDDNSNYSSLDGVLYNKDKTTLIDYPCARLDNVFEIPNSVTSIGNNAFTYCTSLTSIVIPNSVTTIGNNAFSYCTSLTSIVIPNSVTSIGNSAFYYCTSLTSIVIPNSVTSIGDGAFYYCTSLTSIVIPDSVTSIGYQAFYYCTSLTIYAEASSKPSGWNSYWNPSNRPVVWGYVG